MKKKRNESGSEKKYSREEKNLQMGKEILREHPFFSNLAGYTEERRNMGKEKACEVTREGMIFVNKELLLSPKQWANTLIHCKLHLAFGHFDADKMPGYGCVKENGKVEKVVQCDRKVWNIACDAYITRFLEEVKFGESCYVYSFMNKIGRSADEQQIYDYLMETGEWREYLYPLDMAGTDKPIVYDTDAGEENLYAVRFASALAFSVSMVVSNAGGHGNIRRYKTPAEQAAEWFINRYPLLGSLAAAFRIEENVTVYIQEEVRIAAVDSGVGIIYINPAARLNKEELKFVLAHEYLHVGLQHQERCQGRDPYLWNVACDYVINGWLKEMEIGKMPEQGLLYDETLKGMSAEAIYDMMLTDIRRYSRLDTLRGYGKGDVIRGTGKSVRLDNGITLDEFCRNALYQGLEYEQNHERGVIPAGLIEEIRALAMPPIPWDVELARWFEQHFPLLEPKRTYARPSRRQGSAPDIPRPRYVKGERREKAETFGVVIDTSGSVSAKMIGIALGCIASYAAAREVAYVRVVFCDAAAYDAGYLTPEEIAGRVQVKGRGGTILQPGIDLLETAKDFPKNGPILIITDGEIETKMKIHHEHAFLMPKGKRLPFEAAGEVFYYE